MDKLIDSICKTVKHKGMNFKYFIGIDVSKNTLDFCLVCAGKVLCYLQTPNTIKGIQDFIKRCKKQFEVELTESLICMEHTGIYWFIIKLLKNQQ
jgi:hypothetical protein